MDHPKAVSWSRPCHPEAIPTAARRFSQPVPDVQVPVSAVQSLPLPCTSSSPRNEPSTSPVSLTYCQPIDPSAARSCFRSVARLVIGSAGDQATHRLTDVDEQPDRNRSVRRPAISSYRTAVCPSFLLAVLLACD
jgi:hypothetical protein